MAPTSLTALLASPTASASNESTVLGRTLPDITLGSLGSSFRSEDEDERRDRLGKPVSRGELLSIVEKKLMSSSKIT
jgi:hypothetical protein